MYSVNNAEKPSHGILFEVEELLMAIRKDLGHSNKGISRGKILSLFVNDINEYL